MSVVAARRPSSHDLQLYDEPSALAARVTTFCEAALDRGGAAVAIARADLLAMIEARLIAARRPVRELRMREQLVLVDVDAMLEQLVRDGAIDRARFDEQVGALVARSCARFPGVPPHVYGELVDALWARGDGDAVVALEQLWSQLMARLPFVLLCGYQLAGFGDGARADHAKLHTHHDATAPALSARSERDGSIAQLEQRALALETELAHHLCVERRLELLLALGSRLAAARSDDEIARIVVDDGIDATGAASVSLWLADGERVTLLHASPAPASALAIDHDAPRSEVLRTGVPLFLGSFADYAARFGATPAPVADALPPACALAVLPLVSEAGPRGALVLGYDHERAFTSADRTFKAILARQCALALERVRRHDDAHAAGEAAERAARIERAARDEVELVFAVTAAANQSAELPTLYELALSSAERGARADRSAIVVRDDDGALRCAGARGLDDAARRALDDHAPWRGDEPDPQPIVVADGRAFVPIVHQGELLGQLVLVRDVPRGFTTDELRLATSIAVQVGHAIARDREVRRLARAYAGEQRARLDAEEATRAREEILSVVSHDLRNPLNTVMLGAASLLQLADLDAAPRTRSIAERIHRQAARMARQIEDLVDFTSIQTGRLALDRAARAARDHRRDERAVRADRARARARARGRGDRRAAAGALRRRPRRPGDVEPGVERAQGDPAGRHDRDRRAARGPRGRVLRARFRARHRRRRAAEPVRALLAQQEADLQGHRARAVDRARHRRRARRTHLGRQRARPRHDVLFLAARGAAT